MTEPTRLSKGHFEEPGSFFMFLFPTENEPNGLPDMVNQRSWVWSQPTRHVAQTLAPVDRGRGESVEIALSLGHVDLRLVGQSEPAHGG